LSPYVKKPVVCTDTTSWDVNISEDDFVKLKAGFVPQNQDDKWRVWHTEERHNGNVLIYYARAGTGNELYIHDVKPNDGDSGTGANIKAII